MGKAICIFAIFALILLNSLSLVCADSDSPVIAIIDSGIASQGLEARLWTNPGEIADNGRDDDNNGYTDDIHGWNVWENSNNLWDLSGMGTEYADIIVNSCSDCRIMPVKLSPVEYAPALASAIIYAADNGADVISIGILWRENPEIRQAVEYARGKNAIVVASASYEFLTMRYPAAYDNVIAVTSIDDDNTITYGVYIYAMKRWGFAPYIDFVVPVDDYRKSAPYLAGVIGGILSDSEISHPTIKEHLCERSHYILDPLGDGRLFAGNDRYTGCGKIER